ncbi:predicted protein [Histoplasma mississippiense (nom. inval.)]|uniref:predicted protein n=1 Tax=Ajellomyces capsulatus (strain NAm1 / WU24) TaxID=2059318 RepID=UPI000157C063|nr:predicted protein [Histoplasma mississippiense (nom. inval.)]EDN06640.1 predicted protein [Histoplasma mississippiense (nom. inval.)]
MIECFGGWWWGAGPRPKKINPKCATVRIIQNWKWKKKKERKSTERKGERGKTAKKREKREEDPSTPFTVVIQHLPAGAAGGVYIIIHARADDGWIFKIP